MLSHIKKLRNFWLILVVLIVALLVWSNSDFGTDDEVLFRAFDVPPMSDLPSYIASEEEGYVVLDTVLYCAEIRNTVNFSSPIDLFNLASCMQARNVYTVLNDSIRSRILSREDQLAFILDAYALCTPDGTYDHTQVFGPFSGKLLIGCLSSAGIELHYEFQEDGEDNPNTLYANTLWRLYPVITDMPPDEIPGAELTEESGDMQFD